jgi:hypothetical protein
LERIAAIPKIFGVFLEFFYARFVAPHPSPSALSVMSRAE